MFDYVELLFCKCHKISLNGGGSYIGSCNWIKNKKTTPKPNNKKRDNKCFHYAVTVTLNQEEMKKGPQKITNIYIYRNIYAFSRH